MPCSDAQTASPLTLSVPGGSDTVRAGPTPRNWMVPMTEPDVTGAARAIETIKREKLAGYEAPRGIGGEAFRAGRAGCEEDQDHHRQPCNHTEPFPVTFSDSNLLLVSGR